MQRRIPAGILAGRGWRWKRGAVAIASWLVVSTGFCRTHTAEFAAGAELDLANFPGAAEPRIAPAAFGEMVRDTPWLAPEAQREALNVPAGFEVRLFASEPQIAKPLNLAIDDRGRMWMTQTTAYPYPAADGSSETDAVMILEDTTGDGHADRVTKFAGGLNIPIGILPFGEGCIVFSIPNLLYLRDTTGDGVCDTREVLYGPFDTTRDTHGMVNALRDGGDGWIYACHGFNNRSVVAGKDGHEVRLESGNTFRFRPDGSRIEQYTQGQVNPFGMTRDDWGNWFTADCHSKPITQLVRGACYPSFGRPHDGLGFLPPTIDHLHGSTAISGIVHIPHDSPLRPLRGQLLSGNVMTSRINRDLLTYQGATARGIELPDFLTSDDPWFRPVDLQLDAQGNLYVADFYNKIIGHYEVPLDHPDRDRTSGRVWRIHYVGESTEDARRERVDRTVSATSEVDDSPLADRIRFGPARQRVAAIRQAAQPLAVAATPSDRKPFDSIRQAVVAALGDEQAHVARAAAEWLGKADMVYQDTDDLDIVRLSERLPRVDPQDPVLRQTIRIAIRDRLSRLQPDSPVWQRLLGEQVAVDQAREVATILLAIPDSRVVPSLVGFLRRNPSTPARQELTRHAATHAGEESLLSVIELARELTKDSPADQAEMLEALFAAQGRFRASAEASEPLRRWALELASHSLGLFRERIADGDFVVGWSTSDGQPWDWQARPLAGGGTGSVRSSFTRGERYVGTLVSDPFPAPPSIRFRLAGHGGPPDQPDHQRNGVRVVRVADNQVLHQQATPRSDTAAEVTWDLSEVVGEHVRIECRDGDAGNAYAWIAIGQFEPSWIDQPEAEAALANTLRWYLRFGLSELSEPLREIIAENRCSASLRVEIATALAGQRGDRDWESLLAGARATPQFSSLADNLLSSFLATSHSGTRDSMDGVDDPLTVAIRELTSHLAASEEIGFARTWVARGGSPRRLVDLCELGWLSPGVLADGAIRDGLFPRLAEADRERMERLTENLAAQPVVDHETLAKLSERSAAIEGDFATGAAVYTRHCAACHQLRGTGTVIGPQLDGVVTRSHARLLEDILIPDQNVDAAFRTTSLLLDDGRVLVGMIQTEDETEVRIADAAGKSLTVATDEIQAKVPSPRSLMPGNFAELLTAEDLAHLIRYIRGL